MKQLKSLVCLFFFTCILYSCIAPYKKFEKYDHPVAPDYSKESSWASLPDLKDSADAVPYNSELKDGQANALVDVFYIYPTTYFSSKNWNAAIDNESLNKRTDKYPMREQASAFNESCRVYAPRYRQATLYSFLDKRDNGRKALELAYLDVKNAFTYYLTHYNKGRPLIIASHSQGTWHAVKLMKEFFEGNPKLSDQLVAAYLIGGPASNGLVTIIAACDSARQTNCFVAWHTMAWGKHFSKPRGNYKNIAGYDNFSEYVCVNPLTWKRDQSIAPAYLNKGAIPYRFDRIDSAFSKTQCTPDGALWTHKPKGRGYPAAKNYHILDYNLFYMNIRNNVKLRIDSYWKMHAK